MSRLQAFATLLDRAATSAQAVQQLSASGAELTLPDAYRVQQMSIALREQRGERLIGVKAGFTSRAKMIQMQVSDLIWGWLTDAMLVEDGGQVSLSRFIHPRIEPEVAFLLKRPLSGRVSLLEAQAAVDAVAPCFEIIDSRYENFKFSLADVIADNSSSSALVVGAWSVATQDLSNLGMVMSCNGRPRQIGSSAAILGNPWRSLVALARLAAQSEMTLEPGWIVMAGAATAAEPLQADSDVLLEVESLGRVQVRTQR